MKDTVIKVLNEEHGKKVIEYFKSKGIDTHGIRVLDTVGNGGKWCYYVVLDNEFNSYSLISIAQNYEYTDIIELPKENEYPKVMLVRDKGDDKWKKRVVLFYKCGVYIAWHSAETIEEAEKVKGTNYWEEAKDLPPKRKVTKAELAEILGTDNYEIVD